MPNVKKQSEETKTSPAYEEALAKLDAIVRRLEDEEPPLAELVSSYEQGMKLYKICEERLREAELSVELLQKKERGEENPAASSDVPPSVD